MATYTVLTNPNTELRKKSEELSVDKINTEETNTLIQDMIETMILEKGVGIAAPQMGIHKRIIIVDIGNGPQAIINPKIVSKSFSKVDSEEGCLSVPGVYGIVERHKKVKVKAYTQEGKKITIKTDGFPSIVLQHEIDHLNGILFIDKVTRYTQPPKKVL